MVEHVGNNLTDNVFYFMLTFLKVIYIDLKDHYILAFQGEK